MATFTPVNKHLPANQRICRVTSVAAGDRIDVKEILGRSGRVKFITAATSNVVQFRLNNKLRLHPEDKNGVPKHPVKEVAGVTVWSAGPEYSTFSLTGATEYLTEDGIAVNSVEIESITGVGSIQLILF